MDCFVELYESSIRSMLFSASITMASFLVALRTFLLITIKEKVYSKEYIRKRMASEFEVDQKTDPLLPLKHMSRAITCSLILSLISATMQLTLGLYPTPFTAVISFSFGLASIVALLIVVLVPGRLALKDWFDAQDEEVVIARQEVEREYEERRAKTKNGEQPPSQ